MTEKKYEEIKFYKEFRELELLKEEQIKLEKSEYSEKNKSELINLKRKIKIIRDKLIKEHLYISEILAKKYSNRGVEYDDLYQIASMGLIMAIDRFTTDRGYEFSSFATPTITGEIKRYFRDKGWVIRVPRKIQELSRKINEAKVELTQKLQRNPKIDEIAEFVEASTEDVIEALEAGHVFAPSSIDQSVDNGSDKEISLSDLIGESDDSYEKIDTINYIKETMLKLPDLERKIIYYRFFEKMTQLGISQKLEISQMTVSRLEKKAIKIFREELGIK